MKKVLSVLLVICCLLAISGCGKNVLYNAQINSHANEIVKASFIEDNPVNFEGDTFPKTRTLVITDNETYSDIFTDEAPSVNFDTQMVVLHIFVDVYVNRDYHIDKMEEKNGTLNIYFEVEEKHGVGDASQPYQRSLIIIMDKADASINMVKN